MLHDFIEANRDEITSRAKAMVSNRPWPAVSTDELEHGIPLFLTQLIDTLREATEEHPRLDQAIGASATRHGSDLLGQGFTVSQVVHDYGDVCQSITALAVERGTPISTTEFHTLNRCLDIAIAESVTEFGRLREEATASGEAERIGQVAHELRNKLHTAMLSFHVLKTGKVGITGNTGEVLHRSLFALRDLIDAAVAEVRLSSEVRQQGRVSLKAFIEELTPAASLHAEYSEIGLTVDPVDPSLAVQVDSALLASAVMNLLQNAFKYTHRHGQVTLRTRRENGSTFIEVEDQCGGMAAEAGADPFRPFGERRGSDRSGLGLGLSISRKAVEVNGGQVRTRNLPGQGCIFEIELPSAPPLG